MLMVNTFVVNVALPAMARDLNVDLGTAQWIVSGFVLTLGVVPVAGGRLADILGRREVYMAGLALFVASSIACALATDVYVLIAFRVVQGVGAAIMQPATLSIVTNAFPAEERGLAVGIWGGVSGLGLVLGPVLGGLLVHGDNWRLVFLVNVPVGLAALVMAFRYVPRSRDGGASRAIDWPGVGLLSGGLLLAMLGITRGNADGWTSATVLGCLVGAAAVLWAFAIVESRTRAPLVDLSLFRSRTFVMACVSAFLFSACVFGSQPYTSLFMQNFWGMTPLEAGFGFLPSTALVALLMPAGGVVGQKLGHHLRLLVMAGSISVASSFLYLLTLGVESRYLDGFLLPFLFRGAGIGLVMTTTSLAVVSAVPLAKSGLASGTLTMARNVGTAAGVALLGAIYLARVETGSEGRFAEMGGPPAGVVAAAGRFVAAGTGDVQARAAGLIVDGYVVLAMACAVLAGIATLTAGFIRHARLPQKAAGRATAT
ncbi:MAG TPA: DHA2 family efflux MFS transporter permease subunit, partial [Dehalococcoidia bacterium]|nr:DHA2 family efflux MFS transporter permease subunit [Dehalococcoidia bacterium]